MYVYCTFVCVYCIVIGCTEQQTASHSTRHYLCSEQFSGQQQYRCDRCIYLGSGVNISNILVLLIFELVMLLGKFILQKTLVKDERTTKTLHMGKL